MTARVTPATALRGLKPNRLACMASRAAAAHSIVRAGMVTNGPCKDTGISRHRNVNTGNAAEPNVTATNTPGSWEDRPDRRATSGAMM